MLVFERGIVGRVASSVDVCVVDGREALAVGGAIHETMFADADRLNIKMFGDGEISVQAVTLIHMFSLGFNHGREPPDGHTAKACICGGEEVPILHLVAKSGVGDIVGRQGKRIDLETGSAVGQGRQVGWGPARVAQIITADQEITHVFAFLLLPVKAAIRSCMSGPTPSQLSISHCRPLSKSRASVASSRRLFAAWENGELASMRSAKS